MYLILFYFLISPILGWRFVPPPINKNKPIIKVDTSKILDLEENLYFNQTLWFSWLII